MTVLCFDASTLLGIRNEILSLIKVAFIGGMNDVLPWLRQLFGFLGKLNPWWGDGGLRQLLFSVVHLEEGVSVSHSKWDRGLTVKTWYTSWLVVTVFDVWFSGLWLFRYFAKDESNQDLRSLEYSLKYRTISCGKGTTPLQNMMIVDKAWYGLIGWRGIVLARYLCQAVYLILIQHRGTEFIAKSTSLLLSSRRYEKKDVDGWYTN